MIRFLQTPGPTKKIILGGMLLVICAAMVITLVPGGISDSIGLGGPGQGVVAKVAGEPVTTLEVQREARQMLRQQFPRGGAQTEMLLPYFAERAAQNLISKHCNTGCTPPLFFRAASLWASSNTRTFCKTRI